ncbi:hypothetical protein, partial [uncultured Ruminococcus sp.]|uniref:hypothetical protein n=1 Tax=uncultured Ruminococcus sp. TaxID=165186 RepID=UPI0026DC29E2
PRPADYKSAALPTELHQRFSLFHKRFCFVFVSLVDCSYIIPYEVPNVNTFFKLFLKISKKFFNPTKAASNPFVFFVYKNKKHRKGCFLFFGPPEVLFLILLLSASYITACSQL